MTSEQRRERLEAMRRARELGDVRRAAEHATTFSQPATFHGTTLHWRSDGYYRIVPRNDETPEELRSWVPCHLEGDSRTGEITPGDSPDPTWWLYTGRPVPSRMSISN